MSSTFDPDLIALQERWTPAWKIWRARRSLSPGIREGSYCASRMDDSAGVTPFLMSRSPQVLHKALEAQAEAASSGALSAPEPGICS